MNKRVERFLEKMAAQGLEAMIINNLKNVYYLTGFWGSNGTVLITPDRQVLVTDLRYIIAAKEEAPEFEIVADRDELAVIAGIVKDMGLSRIGFEDEISVAYHSRMEASFAGLELLSQSQFVEGLRILKDESEIAAIRKACSISDQAFRDALDYIKPGKTEIEIANFLDFRMRELGAAGLSFDTILASGVNSSKPHAHPMHKPVELGEAITMDFGCLYDHYVSDMTRTIYLGHVSDEQAEIYTTVLKANQALIDQAKAGLGFRDFDKIPRDIIIEAGYGDYFTHGIGHGIGLDIHEEPYFNQQSKEVIQAGMVLTDEPGIYLEDKYGVRIEDDILITETGCELLTLAPKELIVI
ncbi:Aminopeptidase YpdF (MP-, MA-, MS-, AP-, NP- specific) [Streptococcus sp. DD10]|uniref:M24 family metallopeptidase n=1 Tax=Streptococcus sp. DD10 TaxID=1777878 RepID=UPI0007961FF7|nr:Xaa-Pro peptidase family protein [Streptococcus sp. DD10]KXT72571.1 Aminopeptidase YpdF (MP-, MA-, MS-, AP-, NP- specific) [Streptococcus sp. DD10]